MLVLAVLTAAPGHALETNPNPALATRLGYIVTGDAQVDGVAKAGLEGLSEYVNRRTAAALVGARRGGAGPDRPELLSAAVLADHRRRRATDGRTGAALNDYMSRGGIILIDTRDSGSAPGFAPGTDAALQRVDAGPG